MLINDLYISNSLILIIVLCSIYLFVSFCTIFLIRKYSTSFFNPKFSDIHGHMFGVIGIIYAVLIGAIAVDTWDKFKMAEAIANKEATIAINIYNLAPSMGDTSQIKIQKNIEMYLNEVVNKEWEQMYKGISPAFKNLQLIELNKVLMGQFLENKKQEIYLPLLAQQLNELNQMREDRLFISVTYINYIILSFVFIGGFFLLLSLALIGLEFSLSSNFVLSSILSILIGLVLGITIGLDRPYQGDISVSNQPFVAALNFIQSLSMR